MEIREHVLLGQFTTFKIGGRARYFCDVKNVTDLQDALLFVRKNKVPFFILGGGSNLLIHDEGFPGLVIKIEIKGISKEEKGENVFVTASAGESWDDFVAHAVEMDLWGLENLSLIPGTVGATPVQNIGAYGVEVKDFIHSVATVDMETGKEQVFTNTECQFAYRDSIFKKNTHKKYCITSVTFSLHKIPRPNLSYKDIREYFASKSISSPSLVEIRNAVIEIRKGKFPDLSKTGTAGSFWKNPIIPKSAFEDLKTRYKDIPSFVVNETTVKVPLAWILDNVCHLKGMVQGYVGLYKKQPLVLMAEQGAKACDVINFAEHVSSVVKDAVNIAIEKEVEYVPK